MSSLQRSFSKLAEKVLSVDSLQYKYPWTLSQIGNVKLSTIKTHQSLKALSILATTFTKDVKVLGQLLKDIDNKLKLEGLSYSIFRDFVNINLVGDEGIKEVVQEILKVMKDAQTGKVRHGKSDETVESILVRSCFELPVVKESQPLFTGEYYVATNLDIKESDFLKMDSKVLQPSELNEYKPAMVLVESPSDSCQIALAFKSPGISSPDYYLFKFFSSFLSTDQNLYLDQSKQFNYLNSLFSGIPGIYSHSLQYYTGYTTSLLIHTLNTHPFSAAFAAASTIKATKRACREIILYELERSQGNILNSILANEPIISQCLSRNFDLYSNKPVSDFKDFVINLNEEYILRALSKYFDHQFPSIVLKGQIPSDNAIENIFNIKL